jgi:hypothetical protein
MGTASWQYHSKLVLCPVKVPGFESGGEFLFDFWARVGVEKGFGDMEESFIKTT